MEEVKTGTGRRLREGTKTAVLSLGPIGNNVEKAIQELASEGFTPLPGHYDMRFVKPLDESILNEVCERYTNIITIEDGCRAGGFGSAVAEWLADNKKVMKLTRLGLPDKFIEHGTVAELHHLAGIDTEAIKQAIQRL